MGTNLEYKGYRQDGWGGGLSSTKQSPWKREGTGGMPSGCRCTDRNTHPLLYLYNYTV